jgi:beta-lactamase regulating signal transducer with metallopeptidase domain
MFRLNMLLLGLGGLLAYPLLDTTVKSTVILLIAASICFTRRRDSAAARHFVWATAVCLIVAMPVLSWILPQWRVLPTWMTADLDTSTTLTALHTTPVDALPENEIVDHAQPVESVPEQDQSSLVASIARSANVNAVPDNALGGSGSPAESSVTAVSWIGCFTLIWLLGCLVLLVRLLVAAWLLRRSERRCVNFASSLADEQRADTSRREGCSDWNDVRRIAAALDEAKTVLGVQHPVSLLLDPQRSIPVVWGLRKIRLQLPLNALQWSDEQLQSVLLHELAHVRRRDLAVLTATQIACALYWFNPLVWVAAWRMHVERERACDDLVLSCGVRASLYAEHLVSIVAQLTSGHWTQACGLAMARTTGLESRLVALLSAGRDRRTLTLTVSIVLICLGCAVAIPMSMLRAASAEMQLPENSTPSTGETGARKASGAGDSATVLPEGIEPFLDWSEPVNGLRGAVLVRAKQGDAESVENASLSLILQNVSTEVVRLSDTVTDKTANKRTLYLRQRGRILFGIGCDIPSGTDVVLLPQQMLRLDFFNQPGVADGAKQSDAIVEGLLKDPYQAVDMVLNIGQAPAGTWTGRLQTPVTRGALGAQGLLPTSKEGRQLLRHFIDHARLNGAIPNGLVRLLQERTEYFIEINTGDAYGDPYAKKMQPLLARFERAGDWTQAEVVSLFDEIAVVSTIPLFMTLERIRERTLQQGSTLPPEYRNVNWGTALAGGLKMAWVLEPAAHEYHLGSALKSRVLIHNSSDEPIAFVTRSFHQPKHTAKDAQGQAIATESAFWTTIGQPEAYRLHPGEYCEVYAPGIGIGARQEITDDSPAVRVGTWLLAKAGDDVTFVPGEVLLTGDHNGQINQDWWRQHIQDRLKQDAPLPADVKERELILFRAVRDLFGTAPHTTEADSFYPDDSPQALEHLAEVLVQRSWLTPVTGAMRASESTFKVLEDRKTEAAARGRKSLDALERLTSAAAMQPTPQHDATASLLRQWRPLARTNGDIPGALVAELQQQIETFRTQRPDDPVSSAMAELAPKFDGAHDWSAQDLIPLLDQLAALSSAPLSWTELRHQFAAMRNVQRGGSLPKNLENAAWGPSAENGLRVAWTFEPVAEQYYLQTVLKSRVLFHNKGQKPIVFQTDSWHQDDRHQAVDANGNDLKIESTWYSGITPTTVVRLKPGEYTEVPGHGIGIGAAAYVDERSTGQVGAVLDAKEWDSVRFTTTIPFRTAGWTKPGEPDEYVERFRATIAERLAFERPLPDSPEERRKILTRVMRDLFGTSPTIEEADQFANDSSADPLGQLVARLQQLEVPPLFEGELKTGEQTFRVLGVDPEAATRPRVATSAGRYVLGERVHLQVTQITTDEHRTNKATVLFLSEDVSKESVHRPYEIALPDGLSEYAILWRPNTGMLQIVERGRVRSLDFSNPESITESVAKENLAPEYKVLLPDHLR